MAQQTIEMHFSFNAPLSAVFADLSDHERFGEICGIKVRRIKDGRDLPNGLGSVRKLSIGPLPSFEETITGFELNKRIEYKITRGSPIKNHVGELRFSKRGEEGCSLRYTIKLESKIPGTTGLIKNVLKNGISKGITGYSRQIG